VAGRRQTLFTERSALGSMQVGNPKRNRHPPARCTLRLIGHCSRWGTIPA